jgi:hypothetical protein
MDDVFDTAIGIFLSALWWTGFIASSGDFMYVIITVALGWGIFTLVIIMILPGVIMYAGYLVLIKWAKTNCTKVKING